MFYDVTNYQRTASQICLLWVPDYENSDPGFTIWIFYQTGEENMVNSLSAEY